MILEEFAALLAPVITAVADKPLDAQLQSHLNATFGPQSRQFQLINEACHRAIAAGWMCNREGGGIRFGRVIKAGPATHGFSVDVVHMKDLAGPHHRHPNGEIDMIMPIDATAEFDGQPAGWRVYAPDSAHRPTVTQGSALVLYLLPQGAIDFTPPDRVPSAVEIPHDYNAAFDLLERNLLAGRADKIAYIDDSGAYTYGELNERVNRCSNALVGLGLHIEQRVMLCLQDSIDFPVTFLGCIKAGLVPVAVNTLLTPADYAYMLHDSRAFALVVSDSLLPAFSTLIPDAPFLKHVIVSGGNSREHQRLADLLAQADPSFDPAPTTADDSCFWLYSSGSTGKPKGTVHVHSSLIQTAELYAQPVLGIQDSDVVFSAAKLFFAYGLGNSLTFPLSVGATAVLMAERPTPAAVIARLQRHQPSIFYGVPTLFASLLADPALPSKGTLRLRRCTSAGEALPADIGKRWSERLGVDILDGIGSTEMLHIFLSNRPGNVRYGTTGKPVPGYEVRLVDDHGTKVNPGEIGDLEVCGPTCAKYYWNKRLLSRNTFRGAWTSSGDKYHIDADGYYVYAGRSDDMLKVGGIYVSPAEVESVLITHDAVLEAAVVGKQDQDQLTKPMAYVVLNAGHAPCDALRSELQQHVKKHLAPFKYPRWIEFATELPKTATGKIQRFKLRQDAAVR